MTFARSQKGMSLLGWMVTLAVVAFFASTAFKMFPHYMDNAALDKAIMAVETDKAADVRTVPDFYAYITKAMTVNSVEKLDLREAMEVKLDNGEFQVHLQYERREPLIKNLDLVARFDKEFRVRMP
ncbi:DUF4845 domain-containing protein [Pseudomonas turukhanskensis]|uniref:DUF4845 domain-containing protein n=1 Tax=Pseudomonas turukhanskensis TaxID=1806536 RepID=A0A9W6K562_9PSED|nr:DUF4845 domain-containing protein [Pseudomonas turukhanskensis]GLK88184.1 DUF4845 domain-containing protein [Pseudomonas turukhanskensis]